MVHNNYKIMATIRRLSDDDVKSVFNCIKNNKVPPKQLKFQIIVVGANGLKLSPPSYEYEDGLYVLLKPDKTLKKRQCFNLTTLVSSNKVPSKLINHVMKEHREENCPWSLSGPQFSLPAGIQQRYCYPKGNPEYSRKKGGALWTTYDENGKENLDYRLLHVYFSAKRALRDQTPTSDIKESHVTSKKHRAHHSIFRNDQFPPPICRTPPSFDLVNSHQSHVDEVLHSSSTCFYTPLSAENHDHNYPTWQNYDRLPNRDPNKTTDKSSHDTHFRYHCSNHVSPEVYSTGYPRHFPNESENHSHNPRNERTRLSTALEPPTCHLKNEFSSHSRRDSILSISSCEPLPVDIDIDLFEQTDSLAFSNSKKLNKANNTEHQIQNEYHNSGENKKQIDNFAAYLGDIHKNIQKRIMDSKESEQFRCVDALVYWAKKVAQSPLDISDKKEENTKINLTSLNSESLLINNIDCVRHFAEI